jgi:hypothetical protein
MPVENYELVQQARLELARRGYGSLPDEVTQSLNKDTTGKLALGVVIGLGIAALIYLLSESGKK